jgi:hypothetical protein
MLYGSHQQDPLDALNAHPTPHESGHGIAGTDEILLKGDPSTTFVL